jgi:hypothetical protein
MSLAATLRQAREAEATYNRKAVCISDKRRFKPQSFTSQFLDPVTKQIVRNRNTTLDEASMVSIRQKQIAANRQKKQEHKEAIFLREMKRWAPIISHFTHAI